MSAIGLIIFTLLTFSQTWEYSSGTQSQPVFVNYIKTFNKTELKIGNTLRCMVIQTKIESQPIHIHTPSTPTDNKNYTYVMAPQQNCYNIYIRAQYNAHIGLATHNEIHPVVEFNFRPQGSFNFTYEYNSKEIGSQFIPDLLNIEEYRGYWIEIDKTTGKLSIGKMGEVAFMERNVHIFSIDYIGVSTNNGNIGDWAIKKNAACPGDKNDDINDGLYEGGYKTRCYKIDANSIAVN